ncbi:hypothetical protein [Salinibacter ruber]|uniref:hypothetical protein n=1 Tax=Salinibacter ruber TaxID=146919 RepID=UPI00216A68DF|nr:hypothetical protein [Salinibacter ruber]
MLLFATALLFSGCFEEVSGPYDQADRIAFSQTGTNGTFGTTVPDAAGTIQVPTQLIGPQRSESFSVDVSVQPDTVFRTRQVPTGDGGFEEEQDTRALPTTAEESNYSVPDSYTFPADSSNVPFEVEIQDAFGPSAPADTSARLTLRLEPNTEANVEVAENWRYFEVTIVNQ